MKERPILFSAPMVRALLAGTKTQTRRIAPIADLNIKPHGSNLVTWGVRFTKPIKGVLSSHSGGPFTDEQARGIIASQFNPYGPPGDRLWVREAFGDPWHHAQPNYFYRATDGEKVGRHPDFDGWKPSIHMPRTASRITLELTGVRVERLQDISEADARAEGSPCVDEVSGREVLFPDASKCGTFKLGFRCVWEQINGPDSWEENPWVWVLEFTRMP